MPLVIFLQFRFSLRFQRTWYTPLNCTAQLARKESTVFIYHLKFPISRQGELSLAGRQQQAPWLEPVQDFRTRFSSFQLPRQYGALPR
jgi:hypothetical protein